MLCIHLDGLEIHFLLPTAFFLDSTLFWNKVQSHWGASNEFPQCMFSWRLSDISSYLAMDTHQNYHVCCGNSFLYIQTSCGTHWNSLIVVLNWNSLPTTCFLSTNEKTINTSWLKTEGIAPDKGENPHNISLISPRKRMLWVLIRSALSRRFLWVPQHVFCGEIRKIILLLSWKIEKPYLELWERLI